MAGELAPKCGTCHYFGWLPQGRACFHPDNPRILIGGPLKCKLYEDQETKVLPGKEKWWKERLTWQEMVDKFGR